MHFFAASHDSYFAFAEVEYDEISGRFEITVSSTTHDLERYLTDKKIITGGLVASLKDSIQFNSIQKELKNHFNIKLIDANSLVNSVDISFDGFEVELTGIVRFYCSSSQSIAGINSLEITFDLLMDLFPLQQNKLIFTFRNEKSSYVFLRQQIKQQIQLFKS